MPSQPEDLLHFTRNEECFTPGWLESVARVTSLGRLNRVTAVTGANFLPKNLMPSWNVLKRETSNDHSARFYSQVLDEASPVVFSWLEQRTKDDQHLGDSAGSRFGHFLQLLLFFFPYSQSSPGQLIFQARCSTVIQSHITHAADTISTISKENDTSSPLPRHWMMALFDLQIKLNQSPVFWNQSRCKLPAHWTNIA